MSEKEEIVSEIIKCKDELNVLFEKAASHYVKFDGSFSQDQSFGEGMVGHLCLKAYSEITN